MTKHGTSALNFSWIDNRCIVGAYLITIINNITLLDSSVRRVNMICLIETVRETYPISAYLKQ